MDPNENVESVMGLVARPDNSPALAVRVDGTFLVCGEVVFTDLELSARFRETLRKLSQSTKMTDDPLLVVIDAPDSVTGYCTFYDDMGECFTVREDGCYRGIHRLEPEPLRAKIRAWCDSHVQADEG